MPLPQDGIAWPPAALSPAFERYNEHDAWYANDTGRLQTIYQSQTTTPTHAHGGTPHRGGIYGAVATGFSRMFWGKPVQSEGARTVLHVPMASDVASMASDMLWAEPPTFTAAVEGSGKRRPVGDATQARLDLIMNSPDAHMMFNEAGELCSALGGTFYAVEWNEAAIEHTTIRSYDADTAVPEWSGGRLVAVTFWSQYWNEQGELFRHLERHEVGAVLHGLYKGEDGELGERVPIASLEQMSWLLEPSRGKIITPDLVVLQTGIKRLTVDYQPNVRKNRDFRKAGSGLAMLGRSDYAGIEPELNSLDEAWSSWMRDLKVARARLFVDESMLRNKGYGQGASFDEEQEVYTVLRSLAAQDGKTIEAQQFDIRVEAHERTTAALVRVILRNAGLGSRDYEEQTGQVTATGELRRDKREETTRDKKKRYASAATTYIASVAMELDAILFPGKGGAAGLQIAAEFPSESQVDDEKEARVIGLLHAAQAISLKTKVTRANPDWEEDRIKAEVDAIIAEQGRVMDPGRFPDDDPDPDDEDAMADAAAERAEKERERAEEKAA